MLMIIRKRGSLLWYFLLIIKVECITYEENGCYVELLEYERKKAMIPFNEYTTSMKKNIHRAMRVGRV
jgi:translation initiation factor 2 alpha subunit (eIF-2alpha)